MDVASWLRNLGLERYEAEFRENDVSAEDFCHLTAEDLNGLGVSAIGHRRRLLVAIAKLRSEGPSPGDSVGFPPHPPISPTGNLSASETTAAPAIRTDRGAGRRIATPSGRPIMFLPRFIDIDGRRHLWRDLVALRQAQALPRAEQPTLFELREDHRPARRT